MEAVEWYKRVVTQHYADFSGRARRAEFWYFLLVNLVIAVVLALIGAMIGGRILSSLFALAMLIPSLAVEVRRLHDIDKSGWWLFIALVPLVGAILLIVWLAQAGTSGANRYGADPKA